MPNEVLVEGGARLRAVRKERGYTQERLAELTKLSTRHIAGIEKGEANPSFEVLYTIITALGTSFDAIFNPADEQVEREVQEVSGLYRACPEQGRRLVLAAVRAMVNEGQYSGKFNSTVSSRILSWVLFPQTGHSIHSSDFMVYLPLFVKKYHHN